MSIATKQRQLDEPQAAPLHKLAEVRTRQGVSQRNVARRLGLDISQVHWQEKPASDITLSDLRGWADVLGVPVSELVVEDFRQVRSPIENRAAMVKIMKTVASMAEIAKQPGITRMLEMLREQLVALMPELADVAAWPVRGSLRTLDDIGMTGMRRVSAGPFYGV